MYGLPKDINLSFLQNRRLDQICFGLYQVQFNFDENIKIHVNTHVRIAFSYTDATGAVFEMKTAASATVLVDKLIGKTLTETNSSEDGTLQITFNSGEKLIFYDNNNGYESYEILNRDGKWIVV
jgi:hypothetical protein